MSIFAKNAKQLFMSTSFMEKRDNQQFENSKGDWYKKKNGLNTIRMLPLRENGQPSFIQTVNHDFLNLKTDSGATVQISPVCLNYLFNENGTDEDRAYTEGLLELAIKSGKLSQSDYDSLQEFGGCPICRCWQKYYNVDKMKANDIKGRQKIQILIKDRMDDNPTPNRIFLYSMAITMWVEFTQQAKDLLTTDDVYVNDPDFGLDFKFNFLENKRESKYTSMVFARKSTPFGDIDGDIPNLNKVWLSGVRDYNTLTDVVAQTPLLAKIAMESNLKF